MVQTISKGHCFGDIFLDPSLRMRGPFGMTDREIVSALLQGRPVDRKPSPQVVEEAESICEQIKDPDLYWDQVIQHLKASLAEAKQAKTHRKPPPMAYRFSETVADEVRARIAALRLPTLPSPAQIVARVAEMLPQPPVPPRG